MVTTYPIPSHCEAGIILEEGIMLVFEPITVPFQYKVTLQDADDFWVQYCADCALRATHCRVAGALSAGACILNNKANSKRITKTIQMPVPRHILFFALYDENLRFAYETEDGLLKPMRVSNIYSDGTWCSGGVDYNYHNPMSIYTAYFNSVHNSDLTDIYPYEDYIEGLANGSMQIEKSSTVFDPESRWGSVRSVVNRPSKIEWSINQEPNFLRIRGYNYAKIS